MAKSKEEIIREELRATADMSIKLCQWAVTSLIGLQTAIFFLRTSSIDRMILSGEIQKGEHLPWDRYLVGTAVLMVVAGLFAGMTMLVGEQYRHYHRLLEQKENNTSGLPVPEIKNYGRFLIFALYFTFPALDVLIRTYIQIGVK